MPICGPHGNVVAKFPCIATPAAGGPAMAGVGPIAPPGMITPGTYITTETSNAQKRVSRIRLAARKHARSA
eukprot:2869721-Alexandrium_andersonii.AAC.1